jgi:sigma-B regulation protein RsbU (phosphoserine phosphatase)
MPDSYLRVQRTERFDLRALYETSRILSSSLELEFVLNNLLLTAMSKLLVTKGAAFLFDPL